MKQFKKLILYVLLVCVLFGSSNMSVYAAEKDAEHLGQVVGQVEATEEGEVTEIPIVFVSEEEMNRLIESGGRIARDNWVTDYVALSVTRDPSNSNKANIVLMNVGFMFDIVDSVTGTITFYNSKGQAIVNHKVNETNLIYHIPHTDTVTATGFVSISYALTVSDGGDGTLNTGSIIIP